MDRKSIGYVLGVLGVVNMILFKGVSYNIIPFLSFLGLAIYGVYLLSKEDTPIRVAFEKLKSNYEKHNERKADEKQLVRSQVEGKTEFKTKNVNSETAQKVDYIGIALSVLIVISVFLPWVAGSASASSSYAGSSVSASTGGINGLKFTEGVIALLVGIGGGVMAFKRIKLAFLAGLVNVIIGLAFIFGWFNAMGNSYSVSSSYGSASSSIDPQYGVISFASLSLIYMVYTLTYLKK